MRSSTKSCCARPKHKASLNGKLASHAAPDLQRHSPQRKLPGSTATATSPSPASQPPGYTTVNLAANFDINRTLCVFARIDNLLDHHYQNPIDFCNPPWGPMAESR